MNDFTKKRFDSRIFSREDNGSAFERFVDEFLRLESPEKTLVRGLARGADGSIDIADASQKLEQIVECKFIGADTKSTATERWNEVKGHLTNNLLPLAQGEEKRRNKYRPWLRSEGNLQTYTFVTSAICASTDERNQLRKSIKSFFTEQSKLHNELRHLDQVVVDLRYWDDLVGKSASFAPLFYRWFGGFPKGYGEITLSFGSEGSFKQFLASKHLPYFSMASFRSELGQSSDSRLDSIVQFLTQGNDARAHVIFGPGGVGKTRLAIEACRKVKQAGWWPIRLDRKASVSDLDSICRSQAESTKLLLFVDYAEAFEELDQLSEAVARLGYDGKHRISILASTRSSSLQKVTDRLGDLHPGMTDLSQRMGRDEYPDWVVRKIVHHFGIPNFDEIAITCKNLPAMAAFAGFLFLRDRAQFDRQFGNLVGVQDFEEWAAVRLRILEDRFPSQHTQALLADLVVRLPMPQAEVDVFRANPGIQRDTFDILKADRWIEFDGEAYSAAHDVLADTILARHLSAMPGGEQDRVQDIALAAFKEDRLGRCMAALDRLGEHPVFEKLSGKALVRALMDCDSEKTLSALPSLIRGRLLHPAELIALLASSDVLRARLAKAPEAHLTIARTAEWAATKGRNVIDRTKAELALEAPLASAVAFQHPSNIILRFAHAFDPARFHDDVINRLLGAPISPDSHYLIVSLLKWGTPPVDVQPHMERWLATNSVAIKASFVYDAWLNATGEVDAVRNQLLLWVAEHGTKPEAQFVYTAWLNAQGEVDAVREKLLLWVVEHGTKPEASFAYAAWLNAQGEVDAVREKLLLWVAEHGTKPEASFAYAAWLNATGEVDAVREKLLLWVAEHGTKPEARFAYAAWLNAQGEVDAVREKLLLWVAEHGTKPEASFAYAAWLNATGEVDAVREKLLLWVAEHGTKPEAQFVYTAWLNATGEVDAVREKLLLWVAEHGTKPEAQFVYTAWLKSGQLLDPIETACTAWLREHWRSQDSVYVTKELSKFPNLSRDIVACILAWAGTYPANEDAIFRLSRVSRGFHRHANSTKFSQLIVKSTNVVLTNIFFKRKHLKEVRHACSFLFADFSKLQYPRDGNWPTIVELYCDGLRHGSVFLPLDSMPPATWEIMLREAFSLKKLDPIADAAAIRHAHELIQQVRSPDEYAGLLSSGYLPQLPDVKEGR